MRARREARSAGKTPDTAALAAALGTAGLRDTDSLAKSLAAELTEHARRVELQDRHREELVTAGQPLYELPLITGGAAVLIDPVMNNTADGRRLWLPLTTALSWRKFPSPMSARGAG